MKSLENSSSSFLLTAAQTLCKYPGQELLDLRTTAHQRLQAMGNKSPADTEAEYATANTHNLEQDITATTSVAQLLRDRCDLIQLLTTCDIAQQMLLLIKREQQEHLLSDTPEALLLYINKRITALDQNFTMEIDRRSHRHNRKRTERKRGGLNLPRTPEQLEKIIYDQMKTGPHAQTLNFANKYHEIMKSDYSVTHPRA